MNEMLNSILTQLYQVQLEMVDYQKKLDTITSNNKAMFDIMDHMGLSMSSQIFNMLQNKKKKKHLIRKDKI